MLNAIIGKPRSGKSYEASRYHAFEALKTGRMVVTNLSLNVDYICSLLGEHVRDLIVVIEQDFSNFEGRATDYYFSKPEHFTQYDWKMELENGSTQGPLFIVDEAHFVFSSECTKEILKYLAMHGHMGHDILLLTQDAGQLHRTIRKLIDVGVRTVKLSMVGENSSYKRKVYSGVSMRNSDFVSEETRTYDPQYFKLYQSHTLSDTAIEEVAPSDVKGGGFNPHKNRSLLIIAVGVLLLLFIVFRIFLSGDELESSSGSVSQPVSKPVAPPSSSPAFSPRKLDREGRHPFDKVELHIVGRMEIRGNGRIVNLLQLDASKSDQVVFQVDSVDLLKAGYDVEIYSPCSARISYRGYEEFLVCDSPDRFNDRSSGLSSDAVASVID